MAGEQGSRFNPKVIESKCSKAGISFWLASEVALSLQKELNKPLTDEELNDLIVKELSKRDEESARRFENYHRIYVRTSDGLLESFDKEKIIKSLLNETTLAKNICEEIAAEVESDIRRLELRYVSAPLIREMVNSKLLERRYMQAKNEYTRIGLPIYDVDSMIANSRKLGINPPNPEALHKRFGDAIAEEYALVKILPQEVSKAHLVGKIHIHDLPYFATRPISLQNDLRWFLQNGVLTDGIGEITSVTGPAKHPDVAISHAIRVLISGETHLSGGQSIDFFNTFMAPYTLGVPEKQVSQIIQTFLYELNQIYAVKGGMLAHSTLNFELETPSFLKKEKAILPRGITSQDTYFDYERESIRFLNLFLKAMSEGDYRKKSFTMPKIVLKIREGAIPIPTESILEQFIEKNEITILNLREAKPNQNMNMIAPNQILQGRSGKWYTTLRTGVLQEVSINLPRIALTSRDETDFFTYLDESLAMSKGAVRIKKEIIEKRLHKDKMLPFLTQEFNNEEYYNLDNAPSIVNVIGLDNAVKEFIGEEIWKSNDAYMFAEKVLAYINTKLENFNENEDTYMLFGCLDVLNAPKRFSVMNEKRFGVKEVYPTEGLIHRIQDVDKWIDIESHFQHYCKGAAKLKIDAGDSVSNTIYNTIKKGVLSFTINKRERS